MRVFKEPNTRNDWKCPVCKTAEKKEVVLIGIVGSWKDNIMEAEQIHLDCIDLLYDKKLNIIFQKIL